MHLRMPGDISLYEAHRISTTIEQTLRDAYGSHTHIGLHVEPLKKNGVYEKPEGE